MVSKVEENEHCCRVSPFTLHGNASPYKVNEEAIAEKAQVLWTASKASKQVLPNITVLCWTAFLHWFAVKGT